MAAQFSAGLAVDAHDLLTPGVRHAREDARFRHRCKTFVALDAGERNALLLELLQEQFACFVFANHADRSTFTPSSERL